jgi:hypothetical protein
VACRRTEETQSKAMKLELTDTDSESKEQLIARVRDILQE